MKKSEELIEGLEDNINIHHENDESELRNIYPADVKVSRDIFSVYELKRKYQYIQPKYEILIFTEKIYG